MRDLPTVRIDHSLRRGLAAFDADRLAWLDRAAALGPLAGLRLGPVTTWILTDATAARTMLVTDGDSWTRPPTARYPIRLGVGENLFTQSDRQWRRVQPLVAPAFRKRALADRLAALESVIEPEIGAQPYDTDIDLSVLLNRLALMMAAWVLLGERLDRTEADELADHQQHVVGWVGRRIGRVSGAFPYAFGKEARAMRAHRYALEAYADRLIRQAQLRDSSDHDVLGALLAARPNGTPLGVEALRSHVLGLFFAGNETTAAALGWALVHGAHHPNEWQRVRDEPERARLFVDETLRMTPAVWGFPRAPRRRGATVHVSGTDVPIRRSELVTIYLRGINHNSALWPHPERFDPDRHSTAETEKNRALISFGLGTRGCIGQHVATAEILAAVPLLARHGSIQVEQNIREDANFALRIAGGLRGTFRRVGDLEPT